MQKIVLVKEIVLNCFKKMLKETFVNKLHEIIKRNNRTNSIKDCNNNSVKLIYRKNKSLKVC